MVCVCVCVCVCVFYLNVILFVCVGGGRISAPGAVMLSGERSASCHHKGRGVSLLCLDGGDEERKRRPGQISARRRMKRPSC